MTRPRLQLIKARTDRGWTQGQLCEELSRTGWSNGVTIETVSRWENRKIGVGWKNRRALARAFGLPIDEVSRLIDDDALDEVMSLARGGLGVRGWVVPVEHLPWRVSTALSGLTGSGTL